MKTIEIEIKAKTFDEAIEEAVKQTGKSRDELDFHCEKEAKLFGLIKGIYKVTYTEEEPKKEKKEKKEKKQHTQQNSQKPSSTTQNEDRKPKNQNATQNANQKQQQKKDNLDNTQKKESNKDNKQQQEKKEVKSIQTTKKVEEKVEKQEKLEKQEKVESQVKEVVEENEKQEVIEEKREISSAELDYFVRNFARDFALAQGVEVEVDVQIIDGNKFYILTGNNAHKLIGYHGENLNAMQYIIAAAVNEKFSISTRILLDIEQYKMKREENLKILARKTARKVIQTRRSQKLEPMSANERRIIHSELQSNQKVTTESHGVEPHRFVVIKLK